MRLEIIGKNIDVTGGMKEYVQKKLSRLDKYLLFDESTIARVVARTYPKTQKVEITIPEKFGVLRAEVNCEDFYVAVDAAIDKLEGQVRRQKTRLEKRHRDSMTKTLLAETVEEEPALDFRTKSVTAAVMDVEEAIMQMDLSDHNFFAFTDSDSGNISIVYRKKNGGYGVLEIN